MRRLLWVAVATLLLLCGLFPGVIESFAEAARLSYPSAVLFVGLGAVYLFAFTVSVSLTGLYRPRSFGSSESLRESPKRLKPNTPRLIAMPGNRAIHGAFSAYDGAEPESISQGMEQALLRSEEVCSLSSCFKSCVTRSTMV